MSAKREVTTRSVVIGRHAAGEGSVRAHLYTEELGLVTAIAKSAREERSKLRAHLQSGTLGLFTLVKGERDWRVTGAVDTRNTHFTTQGVAGKEALARVMSVVRQLVQGDGADTELFDALWEFMRAAPALTDTDVCTAERVAVLRILTTLGYVAPTDIPGIATCTYSTDMLQTFAPRERHLTLVINKGLEASGLA